MSLWWDKTIQFTSYFHSYEISGLLKSHGIENADELETYFSNKELIKDYVRNNIRVFNNQKKCSLQNIDIIEDEYYKILSDGLELNYSFICEENFWILDIEILYFIEYELQTNKLFISQGLENLYFKVLTSKVPKLQIDLNNIDTQVRDSDGDGISDEEEYVYQTDVHSIDTDWDEFSDKEEIDKWWNPLSKDVSPGQDLEAYREPGYLKKQFDEIQKQQEQLPNKNALDSQWINDNSQYFWWEYLKEVLKNISLYLKENQWNFLKIFMMVMILGIIHALWPGHSKSLLIGYILQEDKKLYHGIIYSAVFSIIHILDILFLYLLFIFSSQFIDYSSITSQLQFYSGFILIFLAMYLLITRVIQKQSCKKEEKSGILLAAIAGLVPCTFGWSIFLLLFSIGEISWIFPLIMALGLGIFFTLMMISFLAVFLKERLYKKLAILSQIGLIFSIGIIFLVGLFMIV